MHSEILYRDEDEESRSKTISYVLQNNNDADDKMRYQLFHSTECDISIIKKL